MSGETEEHISGWTVDTLRAHISDMMGAHDRRYEQRFEAQEKAVNSALRAAQDAVTKAELATEKRFESVNEFRAQLSDQSRTLMPRNEYEAQHHALVERIDLLDKRVTETTGRSQGLSQAWGYVAAGIGLFIAAATIVVNHGH